MKKVLFMLIVIPLIVYTYPVDANAQKKTSLQEEIIYNILVDRYNNGDPTLSEQVDVENPLTYYGGDLEGIITKLDSIQDLGVTTISLSPIMKNTKEGYHGYWIEDFYDVEEQFGTMKDFKNLVNEAHERDMKVILEFVSNYVASSHPFVTDPTKEDWFKEPNVEPIDSTTWLEDVAVLDQDNPEVENFLIDVADFWISETGVDGFKLHAADQASDAFLEKITSYIKEVNQDFYLLAGTLQGGDGVEKLRDNSNIDAVENELMFEKLNEVFIQADNPISTLYEAWAENKSPNDLIFVDNKNTARFSDNVAENDRNRLTVWKMALTYMYTSPGVPVLYQGSELPMYGSGFPENQMLVQFNSTDPDLAEFHHQISAIRAEYPVLSYGDFEQVGTNEGMSVFKRTYKGESMYVAINNDSESRAISVSGIDSDMQLRGLLGDNTIRENEDGDYRIGTSRESAEVFIIEPNKGFNWAFIGFVGGVFFLFVVGIIILSRRQKKEMQK